MNEIKIWIQMFFDDGSVSQGVRVPAEWLDDEDMKRIRISVYSLLSSLGRDEGYALIWGSGNMIFKHYQATLSDDLMDWTVQEI